MKYDINEVDGHVLLNLDEGAFIVDTGSQASFARGEADLGTDHVKWSNYCKHLGLES